MPGTRTPPGVWAVTFAQVMLSALVAAVMVCKTVVFIAERCPAHWPALVAQPGSRS
jgi:hypothetical protein